MADVLELPSSLCHLVTWMMRREASGLADIAARLGQDEETARHVITDLVNRGFVIRIGAERGDQYQVRPAARQQRGVPRNVWSALDGSNEE